MAGIYFHIPFCKRICAYCDFYKSADRKRLPEVAEAMHRELDARRDYLRGERCTRAISGAAPRRSARRSSSEGCWSTPHGFSTARRSRRPPLEANPDDLTPEYLAALRHAGIDRLSIGVQSFDDDCLRLLNRRHTAGRAIEALRDARRAGFDNLTIDLIFGIPGFGATRCAARSTPPLETGVEHISAYHLTIESNYRLRPPHGRPGHLLLPSTKRSAKRSSYEVHDRLTAAGYEHYEVSNFARPGFRARHNAAYWHGVRYLGIGPAPTSFDGGERHWNPSSVERYIAGEAAENGDPHRPRPLQRIHHDTAADRRGNRPAGGGRAVRERTGRTHPGGAPTVGGVRCGRDPRREGVGPAPAHAAQRRGHRGPFRDLTDGATG